jgi:hypothetical protein
MQPLIDRIPLPCTESCDGDSGTSPQTDDHRTDFVRRSLVTPATTDVDRLIAQFGQLGSPAASPTEQARSLTIVKAVAERLDPSGCPGRESGYARCVISEDPAGWSLAAIVLQPGQSTPAHDHGGWGGAVTLQGIERDLRFGIDGAGDSKLLGEREYPSGTGYTFSPDDVHQPVGADPNGVTVALHFLASSSAGHKQRHHEIAAMGTSTT